MKVERIIKEFASVYDEAMKLGLMLPFVKIDRKRYLTKKFASKLSGNELQKVLTDGTLSVLSLNEIERLARTEIAKYASIVTILSILASIPQTGVGMIVAVVLDFIQFQFFVFVAMQKLLYLYGCKDLGGKQNSLKTSASAILIVISTVMIGKHQAVNFMKSATGVVVKQAIQRFSIRMFSKLMMLNAFRQAMKWLGIVVTKETIEAGMKMLVPVLCGFVSGLITLWLFLPMLNRLCRHLKNLATGEMEISIENLSTGDEI